MRKSVELPKSPTPTPPAPQANPKPVAEEPVTLVREPAVTEALTISEPIVARPDAPEPVPVTAPVAAKPAEPAPAPASTYFSPASAEARTSSRFWRGSPAEIIFATLTAFALIVGVFFSVARIPGPASASNPPASSTSTSSQPAVTVPDHKLYDAAAPATLQGSTVNVKLTAQESLLSIGPGVAYKAWTFNGTVPGPVIRVRQGQTVNFTLVNNTGMAHSIDFHAAETPWSVNYQPVAAGKSFTFSWKANYPGVFMYHCGTPPVIEHIANGMYGAIIVDPASGWSPAKEYVLVQSEFYTRKLSDGSYSYDNTKAMAVQPDYVTFNGYANQYKDAPLSAQLGQRVRIFVVNAGPSEFSAFHVIGAIFAATYADGNPANRMVGNQTITIPPGGGAVVELTIPAAGMYPFMTHSFANGSSGAMGMLEIKK